MNVFYGELAPWWPLISPVEDYKEESAVILDLLNQWRPAAKSLLELGSGGGHVAHYLKARFDCTLTDLSPTMLAVSQSLNPECVHLAGDMRVLDLNATFDIVFAYDAIDYLCTEQDLGAAMATAYRHLKLGGLALFVPDHVAERFEADTDWGGTDGADGRGARFLEWTENPVPGATTCVTHYSFLLREADGTVWSRAERHPFGLFPQATWERLLREAGFRVEVVEEPPNGEHAPRLFFVGHKLALPS